MTLTQVTKDILMGTDTRYQLAVVSNVSEEEAMAKIEIAEESEEMLPVTVVVAGGYRGDKIHDLNGVEYNYAIPVNSTGEIINNLLHFSC